MLIQKFLEIFIHEFYHHFSKPYLQLQLLAACICMGYTVYTILYTVYTIQYTVYCIVLYKWAEEYL